MPTLDVPVADGLDDGTWREGNQSVRPSDGTLIVGYPNSTLQQSNAWLRFQNVTIPQGATIDVAYLSLVAGRSDSVVTVNLVINGVVEDDAAQPSSYADVEGRTRTTASVDWSDVAAWTQDASVQSPSIVDIIQELVDRPGWASGNAMMIYVEDNGSTPSPTNAIRGFYSFEGLAGADPVLHVEYTEAGGGTDNLTATGIATGSPSVGASTLAQTHDLTAAGVTASAPAVGSPALRQVHELGATPLTAGGPVLEAPALGQVHELAADELAAGTPAIALPAIGQAHELAAASLATGAPVLQSPSIASAVDLVAASLTAGTPQIAVPTIGQAHVLIPAAVATDAPGVPAAALGQVHALTPASLASGAPVLGTPILIGAALPTPAERIYAVASEARLAAIEAERRAYTVSRETRVYAVEG